MSEQRILFLDIDDTLITEAGALTPENSDALNRARAAGHQIVICSGRPLCGVLPVAEKLGLTGKGCYLIAYNGSNIYDCGSRRLLFQERLSFPAVELLFARALKHGLYIHTYEDEKLLIKKPCRESEFYIAKTGMEFRVLPNLPEGLTKEPIKVLLINLDDKSRLIAFREEVAPLLEGEVTLFFSSEYLLECVKSGITKGFAVKWLCRYLGIPIENSVAAGDSENDIPMIEAAHVGCAMANATPACKDAADYITVRDCNHSGVAEIIDTFLLKSE